MAILGTLVDKRAAQTFQGATVTTVPHSLPATNPEAVFFQVRSVEAGTAHPVQFSPGGNASLLTVGQVLASGGGASAGIQSFDIFSFVFHTSIR